jgi:translocator protein
MSIISAVMISLGICVVSAILEGIGAGKDVKGFFAKLRSPRLAPPLWIWYIVGAVYYVICFFLAYRILRHEGEGSIKYLALSLLLVFMSINAFWNFIFFRFRNMFYAFLIGLPYVPVAIGLFISLWQFDTTAAFVFLPYLFYLNYATWLGYQNWQLNKDNDFR